MGRKTQRKLSNPDAHERVNYLLHIAHSVLLVGFAGLQARRPADSYVTPASVKRLLAEPIQLAQFYVKTLREVAKKAVIRLYCGKLSSKFLMYAFM